MPPWGVTALQSPWHQTFSYSLVVGGAILSVPSGSFQNPSGIVGNGAVQTSSPVSPRVRLARRSKTSTFMPSPRHCISPRQTGEIGVPRTKQETMSVPPRMDESCRSTLRLAYT